MWKAQVVWLTWTVPGVRGGRLASCSRQQASAAGRSARSHVSASTQPSRSLGSCAAGAALQDPPLELLADRADVGGLVVVGRGPPSRVS